MNPANTSTPKPDFKLEQFVLDEPSIIVVTGDNPHELCKLVMDGMQQIVNMPSDEGTGATHVVIGLGPGQKLEVMTDEQMEFLGWVRREGT